MLEDDSHRFEIGLTSREHASRRTLLDAAVGPAGRLHIEACAGSALLCHHLRQREELRGLDEEHLVTKTILVAGRDRHPTGVANQEAIAPLLETNLPPLPVP